MRSARKFQQDDGKDHKALPIHTVCDLSCVCLYLDQSLYNHAESTEHIGCILEKAYQLHTSIVFVVMCASVCIDDRQNHGIMTPVQLNAYQTFMPIACEKKKQITTVPSCLRQKRECPAPATDESKRLLAYAVCTC